MKSKILIIPQDNLIEKYFHQTHRVIKSLKTRYSSFPSTKHQAPYSSKFPEIYHPNYHRLLKIVKLKTSLHMINKVWRSRTKKFHQINTQCCDLEHSFRPKTMDYHTSILHIHFLMSSHIILSCHISPYHISIQPKSTNENMLFAPILKK